MRETLYSRVKAVSAVPLTAITTNGATNGTAVGLDQNGQDFRVASVVVVTGTLTDGSYAVKVQESADGTSGWADVPASRINGPLPTLTLTDDNAVREFGVVTDPGNASFLRVVVTASGVTTGGSVAALFLLGSPSSYPVVRP